MTVKSVHNDGCEQNKNKDNKFESNDESLLKRFSTALKINKNLTKLGFRGL